MLETAFNDLSSTSGSDAPQRARREARLFCTNPDGDWAVSRRKWCDLAELDEGSFVRAAKKVVADAPPVVVRDRSPSRGGRNYVSKSHAKTKVNRPHQKGGQKTGEGNTQSKLKLAQVLEIKGYFAQGFGARRVSQMTHVPQTTCFDIQSGHTWATV